MHLSFWLFVCIAGIIVQAQVHFTHVVVVRKARNHHGETGWKNNLKQKVNTAIELVVDMEASMRLKSEIRKYSEDQLVELEDSHRTTWTKVSKTASDICIVIFGVSLIFNAFEMVTRRLANPITAIICLTGLLALGFAMYDATAFHCLPCRFMKTVANRSKDSVDERIHRFNIYLWGILALVPVCFTCFFVCFSLGLKSDPLGLHKVFAVDEMSDVEPDWSLFSSAKDAIMIYSYRQKTKFMRHMQSAAMAFLGMAVTSILTSTFVGVHVGGWVFIAKKVSKMVAILLTFYGLLITYVGLRLQPVTGGLVAPFRGDFLYDYVLYMGLITVAVGAFGVSSLVKYAQADEENARHTARALLRMYCGALALITILNTTLFLLAGTFAGGIDNASPNDWMRINATIANYCAQQERTIRSDCPTYSDFKNAVEHSFTLMMLVGASSLGYLVTGFVASMYLAMQDPEDISEAEEGLRRRAKEFIDVLTVLPTVKRAGGNDEDTAPGERPSSYLDDDEESGSPMVNEVEKMKDKKGKKGKKGRKSKQHKRMQSVRNSIGQLSPKPGGESDMDNPLAGIGGMTFETEGDDGRGSDGSMSPPPLDHADETTVDDEVLQL